MEWLIENLAVRAVFEALRFHKARLVRRFYRRDTKPTRNMAWIFPNDRRATL
jgi:hypothetical protein